MDKIPFPSLRMAEIPKRQGILRHAVSGESRQLNEYKISDSYCPHTTAWQSLCTFLRWLNVCLCSKAPWAPKTKKKVPQQAYSYDGDMPALNFFFFFYCAMSIELEMQFTSNTPAVADGVNMCWRFPNLSIFPHIVYKTILICKANAVKLRQLQAYRKLFGSGNGQWKCGHWGSVLQFNSNLYSLDSFSFLYFMTKIAKQSLSNCCKAIQSG